MPAEHRDFSIARALTRLAARATLSQRERVDSAAVAVLIVNLGTCEIPRFPAHTPARDDFVTSRRSLAEPFGKLRAGVNKEENRRYLLNAYRVLLTRARQGMVIFVPPGDARDHTRPPEFYDATYGYLREVAVPER